MVMELERLIDLSVYHKLKNLLPVSVNVVDAWDDDSDINPPAVAINIAKNERAWLELGSNSTKKIMVFTLEIYATTKTQRENIASLIADGLEENIVVYDYNDGFPPSYSPLKIGAAIIVRPPNYSPMPIVSGLQPRTKWVGRVTFEIYYTT
jgi:hypothetical protein